MIGDGFDAVLGAARGGDQFAFAALYRDLNASLLRFFGAHAPSAAEDLTAETWLAVARGIANFEGDERGFRAWMFTIAHRRLVQHWRDTRRQPSDPMTFDTFLTRPGPYDTEGEALGSTAAGLAARAIALALTPDQANVVLLRVLVGLDVDQVAGILGKRPGTVRVLQHKALRRLAKEFSVEAVTL
jgi:RNA polymerase sigma-70 factor, ECF subfamily